mmetsp:Transcript_13358/g.32706  ORF Transcript_13358/g.32706 Transcript_13358/m.32706 type:complete len:264 (+) Transcript_13358:322-1113(+)
MKLHPASRSTGTPHTGHRHQFSRSRTSSSFLSAASGLFSSRYFLYASQDLNSGCGFRPQLGQNLAPHSWHGISKSPGSGGHETIAGHSHSGQAMIFPVFGLKSCKRNCRNLSHSASSRRASFASARAAFFNRSSRSISSVGIDDLHPGMGQQSSSSCTRPSVIFEVSSARKSSSQNRCAQGRSSIIAEALNKSKQSGQVNFCSWSSWSDTLMFSSATEEVCVGNTARGGAAGRHTISSFSVTTPAFVALSAAASKGAPTWSKG